MLNLRLIVLAIAASLAGVPAMQAQLFPHHPCIL
jgi:hypothetical protein